MNQDILTEPEAAAVLRMSTKTLKRRRSAGQIGHTRNGRRVLYRRAHLDEYLNAQDVAASAPPPPPPAPKYRRSGTRSASNQDALLDII
ncbi:helix-turn-helix domain-containing protein [Roseovarius sp.]|uniref:helix-turn-helix domain-containing protein n=1 Tax=Roseovarius sp. TaxID=1486281 RepID=UPI003B5BBDBC